MRNLLYILAFIVCVSCSVTINSDLYKYTTQLERKMLVQKPVSGKQAVMDLDMKEFKLDTIGRKAVILFVPRCGYASTFLAESKKVLNPTNTSLKPEKLYLVSRDYEMGLLYSYAEYLHQNIYIIPNSDYGSGINIKSRKFVSDLTTSEVKVDSVSYFGFENGKVIKRTNSLSEIYDFVTYRD